MMPSRRRLRRTYPYRITMSSHTSRRSEEHRFYDVGMMGQPGLSS